MCVKIIMLLWSSLLTAFLLHSSHPLPHPPPTRSSLSHSPCPRYYPKCRGKVVGDIEIGTPLSTQYYLAAAKGGSYGLEWTPRHFDTELDPYQDAVTDIPGLYLTGEATFVGGFVGAMSTGFFTAIKVLGWGSFIWMMMNVTPVQAVSVEEDESAFGKTVPVKVGKATKGDSESKKKD